MGWMLLRVGLALDLSVVADFDQGHQYSHFAIFSSAPSTTPWRR